MNVPISRPVRASAEPAAASRGGAAGSRSGSTTNSVTHAIQAHTTLNVLENPMAGVRNNTPEPPTACPR